MSWFKFKKRAVSEKDIDISKISPKNRDGDCYAAAANYVIDNAILRGNKNLMLVHGDVTGQGPIAGIIYGHAWVEDGNMVIDVSNGRNIQLPKFLYYAIGRISNTVSYTAKEVQEKLLETKKYGPWQ